MSINYTLYLATNAAPKDVTAVLRPAVADPASHDPAFQESDSQSWIPDGPVSITTSRIRGPYIHSLAEDNGITTGLRIDFQLITEESETAKVVMLRDLLRLLSRMPGDAVFFGLGERLIIRRKSDRSEFNAAEACTTFPVTFRQRRHSTDHIRGHGSIHLQKDSMIIAGEPASPSQPRNSTETEYVYKEIERVRRTKEGFAARLCNGRNGIAGKQWIHAVFSPEDRQIATLVTHWLRQNIQSRR